MTRQAAIAAGIVAAGVVLAACSSGSGHAAYSGPVVPAGDPRPGVSVSAAPGATAGSHPSGAASATAGAKPSPGSKPYVEAVAKEGCAPQTFTASAGLVGGAIHGWITSPLTASPASASARADAAAAAGFAAKQLRTGARALAGCPTATALTAVSEQNVAALTKLSQELSGGPVDASRISAVDALFADVVSQAARLKLSVVEKTPTKAQLGA